MEETIEEKTSKTILQEKEEIEIGGKKFRVAPPSIATLILVSNHISTLPEIELNASNVVEESLSVAKECAGVASIIATLILGAKTIHNECKWWKFWDKRPKKYIELRKFILEECTPKELYQSTAQLLKSMQIDSFFGLTTFLSGINLIKRTKREVEN